MDCLFAFFIFSCIPPPYPPPPPPPPSPLPQLDVVNRGYSGYTSEWALTIADRVLPPSAAAGGGADPALAAVVIFFGANDAALPTAGSARQHVPLARYRRNVASLVAAARAAGAQTVLVVAPGPVDAAARAAHAVAARGAPPGTPADRDLATTAAYAAAAVEAAASVGVPSVDLCAGLRAAAPDDWAPRFLSDGLHLTAAGNEAVFGLVFAALTAAAPRLAPDALPLDFDPHDAYGACDATE